MQLGNLIHFILGRIMSQKICWQIPLHIIHIYICVCASVCMCMHVLCVCMCVCVCVHVCVCVCACVCIHLCVCVHLCACNGTWMCVTSSTQFSMVIINVMCQTLHNNSTHWPWPLSIHTSKTDRFYTNYNIKDHSEWIIWLWQMNFLWKVNKFSQRKSLHKAYKVYKTNKETKTTNQHGSGVRSPFLLQLLRAKVKEFSILLCNSE